MIPAFLADKENRKRRAETENAAHVYDGTDDRRLWSDDEDDEVVLETKGSSPPPQPSPMEEAQAQIELERQRALFQQQEADRQRQQTENDRLSRVEKARPLHQQAYNTAQNYGGSQVRARGYDQGLIDQYGLLDLYNQSVDTAKMGIAEDNLNPMSSYNTNTMFNDALNTVLGTYRGDLNRQLNTYAPEDFAYNTFSDSADDSILQSILAQNKSDALAQIDSAKARGQLNDVGYGRAMTQLGNQEKSGMADLQDLGMGVLSGYRDQLGSLRNDMSNRIGTADFSNPLDFGTFNNRLNQSVTDLTGRMEGDLYRATQGQSFFDPSSIISGSGAIQGFYNPTTQGTKQSGGVTNPLLDAFMQDPNKKNTTGQNGVF